MGQSYVLWRAQSVHGVHRATPIPPPPLCALSTSRTPSARSLAVDTAKVTSESLVEVRPSPIHGRGVFALRALPGRRKIGELSGEIVPLDGVLQDVESQEAIYLVEMPGGRALDCRRGNAFKHLNHACRSNCYLRTTRTRVEVYTRRAIRKGEELTVDYVCTPHRDGMMCGCGDPKCRKVL